jgi:hypothetical protein
VSKKQKAIIIMKRKINKKRSIILGFIFSLFLFGNISVVVASSLKINYYNNPSDFANLDVKYKKMDEYLVYKYLSFFSDASLKYIDVALTFSVDSNWYEKNKIKDVIFLRYDNGSWTRVNYQNKIESKGFKKYQVKSSSLGDYWVIIGILSGVKNVNIDDIILQNKTELNQKKLNVLLNTKTIDTGNQIVNKFIEDGRNVIITLREPAKVKGASVATGATATLSLAALVALLNGPANFLIILKQILLAIIGLFSAKKKLRGGIVYDVNTGKPISLVRVDVIDKATKKIKTTKFTNKEGRYYFLAPQGDYIVRAKKKNYKVLNISKINLMKALLNKEDVLAEVKLKESGVIKKNIALLRTDSGVSSRGFLTIFKTILNYLFKMLFIVGLVFNLWVCYLNPNFLNFAILGIYILVILFQGIFIGKTKYGIIVNKDNKPEAFATVNVFDTQTNKLITRVVTDTKGRYYLLLDKGLYTLEIKVANRKIFKQKIRILGKSALSRKIVLK